MDGAIREMKKSLTKIAKKIIDRYHLTPDEIFHKNYMEDYKVRCYFDEKYYLSQYSDIKEANICPYEHYMNWGWKEGRNPNRYFNTFKYLDLNPDVKKANVNPLYHFVNYGRKEQRALDEDKSNSKYERSFNYLKSIQSSNGRSPEYAPRTELSVFKSESAPKTVAFYLPQFHPFKENDEWWGKGFTEWTNVAKSFPQFEGHYQPRLPSDLGYYDLRLNEVMAQQIDMAKSYGVDAFCFHYYWFAGKRLMERPIEQFLNDKSLDIEFSLCWANENWSRRWDGSENDILIAQEHSDEDNVNVFYDLLRYFKDERYIKIDGKPLLVIYRPDIIPNVKEMTKKWRDLSVKEGMPGLHLVATNSFGFSEYEKLGFDGIVEFPPHAVSAAPINEKLTITNDDFEGTVYDYSQVVDFSIDRLAKIEDEGKGHCYYPTVMTGWDNSARKPGKGNVFHGANPKKFHEWFSKCLDWSENNNDSGCKFVFVNAWNEWAEGTYLEPDKRFGYAWLNGIRTSYNELNVNPLGPLEVSEKVKKSSSKVIMVHIFYEDLICEVVETINKAKEFDDFDVAITIPYSFEQEVIEFINTTLKPIKLIMVENRGRDILPFLILMNEVKELGYKIGVKLHTKKSPHLPKGDRWRKSIYSSLLSEDAIRYANKLFDENNKTALVAPDKSVYSLEGDNVINNIDKLDELIKIYGVRPNMNSKFVGGTMFWFRFEALKGITDHNVSRELFGPELGAIDGTLAHAFERFFGIYLDNYGFKVESYHDNEAYSAY